ncbi:MAG: energy-coupling factor ABC transporter ATP-binding protein [Treponema sp.]|jgi:cobalt/nickel transport system ATP-binding protein|nr:energy-coupling factor ABC transporter ATP-binding protein [Treponema sp.]
MELLSVDHLCHTYDNQIPSLRDVSFSVEAGDRVGIAGANGSGKSTLLELIAGCMKPSSGNILIKGTPVGDTTQGVRSRAGMVFQEPDNQLFMPTLWEDVAFGVMHTGVSPQQGREQALKALRAVEAEHLADRPPYKLSGGEKQRAAIASVLIMEPALVLLDEPTASLDPRARKHLIRLLKTLDCTLLIAGHDLDMMLDMGGRVIFLHEGRIAAQSKIPGLLEDHAFLQRIGLELPLSLTHTNQEESTPENS